MQIMLTIPCNNIMNNIILSPRKINHRKKMSPTEKETPNGKSPGRAQMSMRTLLVVTAQREAAFSD